MASRFGSRGARSVGLLVSALVAAGWSRGGTGPNNPPVVDAGADRSLSLPEVLTLQGSVSDDGLPSGQLTTSWSVVRGPGTVMFVDSSSPTTLATVSKAGQYVLRLSADDGALRSRDEVTFDVAALPGNVIRLDPGTTFQTITGWEALADGQQDYSPAWDTYKDELLDLAVNDLGITRVRLEVRSGVENDKDYWTLWRNGQISTTEWRSRRYSTVNDNGDPSVLNAARFHFSELDSVVDKVVLPLRERVEANGEPFHVNVCYVAFVKQIGAGLGYDHFNANEYAEFAETTCRHLRGTHGIVPDSWEIVLEPDNSPGWYGTTIGNAMAALGPRLIRAGFGPRFVAPSSASMAVAVVQFDQIALVPHALDHLSEISYHRYHDATLANLLLLQQRALAHGLNTAQLEYIGADQSELHEDLKVAGNSSWEQYALATRIGSADTGTSYYIIDDSNPAAPVIKTGSRTHYLRQYFKYVRPGSVRIDATTSNPAFDPVTFVRLDGGYVTVVKASTGGTFFIRDLPAGTYGVTYTTDTLKGIDAPEAVLIPGQILMARIPGPGVLTIHSKSPLSRPHLPAGLTAYGCGDNPAGSLTASGSAAPGGVLSFQIDNPLATQRPGSLSALLISTHPDRNYPCGTPVPGVGMRGLGAPGELLVRGGHAQLFVVHGPPWLGAGRPTTISIKIPARIQVSTVYVQGVLHDRAGPVPLGLTNGLRVKVGFHTR